MRDWLRGGTLGSPLHAVSRLSLQSIRQAQMHPGHHGIERLRSLRADDGTTRYRAAAVRERVPASPKIPKGLFQNIVRPALYRRVGQSGLIFQTLKFRVLFSVGILQPAGNR